MVKLTLILLLFLISCSPEPEFYIDGRPYYTRKYCIKDTSWIEYGYHYGYDLTKGMYHHHMGLHRETRCLEYITDTLLIKEK